MVSFNSVHYVLSTCVRVCTILCASYKFTGVIPNGRGGAAAGYFFRV